MSEAGVDLTAWVGRTRHAEDLISPFQARGMAATLVHERYPDEVDALPPV